MERDAVGDYLKVEMLTDYEEDKKVMMMVMTLGIVVRTFITAINSTVAGHDDLGDRISLNCQNININIYIIGIVIFII